jgi:small subunit ribosomal protein S17
MDADTNTSKTPVVKERRGVVVKNKMQKTVVVEVTRRVRHPKYFKYVMHRARYQAHDETNACKVGDVVIVQETRPMSKNKRWRVKEIVQRATGV